jgi:hypothetical protein
MSLSSRLSLSLPMTLAGATLLALLPVTAGPAYADPGFPSRIPLVDGSRPEGIAGGPGNRYFAGSRLDGTIYTGDLRTGSREVLVAGRQGGFAVGLQYDPATGLVWAAGGPTGTVTAYDGRTGRQVLQVTAPTRTGGRFLNDVDVTRDAVYVTDSLNAELVVVTKSTGNLSLLDLSGDWVQVPSGELLVVNRGGLYAVDPRTGVADLVETTGPALTGGDGLELLGSTLYVVFGFAQPSPGRSSVAVVTLGPGAETATVVGEIPVAAARPTTMTVAAGRGWVVDGNFATANSAGSTHDIVQIDL